MIAHCRSARSYTNGAGQTELGLVKPHSDIDETPPTAFKVLHKNTFDARIIDADKDEIEIVSSASLAEFILIGCGMMPL